MLTPPTARKPECSLVQRAGASPDSILSCASAVHVRAVTSAKAAQAVLQIMIVRPYGAYPPLLVRQDFERRLVGLDAQRRIRQYADLLQWRLLEVAVGSLLHRILPDRNRAFGRDRLGQCAGVAAELRHLGVV